METRALGFPQESLYSRQGGESEKVRASVQTPVSNAGPIRSPFIYAYQVYPFQLLPRFMKARCLHHHKGK